MYQIFTLGKSQLQQFDEPKVTRQSAEIYAEANLSDTFYLILPLRKTPIKEPVNTGAKAAFAQP